MTRSNAQNSHVGRFGARRPRWTGFAAFVLAAGLVTGCASRYKLDAEPPTYAAQANIRVKVNKTGNREMRLRMEHLAPPSRVEGGYAAYAVWIAVPGHGLTKAGILDYDYKSRKGRLVATTPHPKFEVLVSLEQNKSAQQPSQTIIVREVVGAT